MIEKQSSCANNKGISFYADAMHHGTAYRYIHTCTLRCPPTADTRLLTCEIYMLRIIPQNDTVHSQHYTYTYTPPQTIQPPYTMSTTTHVLCMRLLFSFLTIKEKTNMNKTTCEIIVGNNKCIISFKGGCSVI